MEWESVIGLEIHAQLAAQSKIFSGAATAYGAEPNTQACAVDLGLPGVLPVINEKVIEMAVRFGVAVDAQIAERSIFARKNYFYPDLPKGYQISQYETPIVARGRLEIDVNGGRKVIQITRAHLEEDAGKSLHENFHGASGIDLNRAGTPLLEIVSEPDMRSPHEAVVYMRELHRLVRYLKICDGNMQEGSFRCDANVSVRPKGSEQLGTRTEIKNLNSFRFVEKAIEFEIERQIGVIEAGGRITQETRLYDADNDETRPMRTKEDAHDYRYFPDPDLLPVVVEKAYMEAVKAELPELPQAKLQRFISDLGLGEADARALTQDPETAAYFEQAIEVEGASPKLVANWVTGELFGALRKGGLEMEESPIDPSDLGTLVARIADESISGKIAKQVFAEIWEGAGTPDSIIEERGLKQVTDSSVIQTIVEEVLTENPDQVEQLKAGKGKVLGYLVGQVMKKTKGQANPGQVNLTIRELLKLR